MPAKVLFLCTGNSCRSQMAEGFLRAFCGDKFEAYSAGTKPSVVNPRAVQVMKELSIDISNQRSKSIDEYKDATFDYVVMVCDNARQSCPANVRAERFLHWSFQDPAEAKGANTDVLRIFREVRDQIRESIEQEFVGLGISH